MTQENLLNEDSSSKDADLKKINEIVYTLITKKRISYSFKTNHDFFLNYLHAILHRLLSEFDLSFLTETIYVIVIEQISNFLKAIVKRIYFLENNLDINNYKDYTTNILKFKEKVLENWNVYDYEFEKYNFSFVFEVSIENEHIQFKFRNNIKANIFERDRIENRISADLNQMNFYQELDSTEGGGLGILMTISLLENYGISRKNFCIVFNQDSTVATISIPLKLNKPKVQSYLKELIFKKLDSLPSFPEYIQDLIEKCDSGEVATEYIQNKILKDPALVSQILKLASSAGYITRNKVPNLKLSINLIGLKQLKHLLMIYAVKNIFSKISNKSYLEDIWIESNRIGFYARKLQKKESLKEVVFLIGILNLIGKLVIYSLNAEEIQKISILSQNRLNLGETLLEELAIGISYPEVGAILAETWKFPEEVTYGIRYQLKPLQISENKIDLIYPVYLAKCINEIQKKRLSYDFIEYKVLKYFKILGKEKEFLELCNSLNEEFINIYS
ncbi:MAG: HDOD domain-containing protein [Leptonema sp. (in: bacteria)]